MVKQTSKERRQAIRARRVLSIQYRLYKRNNRKTVSAWRLSTTEDMSVTGLSFISESEYRTGDIVELKVVMSGILDIFSGLAKVKRVDGSKSHGCFFIAVEFIVNPIQKRGAKRFSTVTKKRSASK